MKICKVCKLSLSKNCFNKDSTRKDGLQRICRICKIEHYNKTKSSVLENKKEYYSKNKDTIIKYQKEYRDKFPEKAMKGASARLAKRRAAKLKRTPQWLTEKDFKLMKSLYESSKRISNCIGVTFHLDHEIPLQGKNVSGLHCPSNLQIIYSKLNLQKKNNFQIS